MVSPNRTVKIVNSHGATRTSRAKALKYVESGRAVYVDERTIRFVEEDPRHLAVGRAARLMLIDGGMATLGAIAGLPVVHPVELITLRTRRSRPMLAA